MSWMQREDNDRQQMYHNDVLRAHDEAIRKLTHDLSMARKDAEWHRQAVRALGRQVTGLHAQLKAAHDSAAQMHSAHYALGADLQATQDYVGRLHEELNEERST